MCLEGDKEAKRKGEPGPYGCPFMSKTPKSLVTIQELQRGPTLTEGKTSAPGEERCGVGTMPIEYISHYRE